MDKKIHPKSKWVQMLRREHKRLQNLLKRFDRPQSQEEKKRIVERAFKEIRHEGDGGWLLPIINNSPDRASNKSRHP